MGKKSDQWYHFYSLLFGQLPPFDSQTPVQFSLIWSLSHVWLFTTPWTAACQASLSPTPRVYPNSYPESWWCHPTISSSVVPFSSHLQSFSASGSFPMSQPFASGGQSTGVLASASVLPMNTQDWSPLGWTRWISLQSQGLSRVFSNIHPWKHKSRNLSLLTKPLGVSKSLQGFSYPDQDVFCLFRTHSHTSVQCSFPEAMLHTIQFLMAIINVFCLCSSLP